MSKPYDTRRFMADLQARGLLHRVTVPVSRDLEISQVYDRVVKQGGPALLFERVEGSPFPVLINQFGTWERMVMALGREPQDIGQALVAFTKLKPPKSFREAFGMARKVRELLAFPPKTVRKGACQDVVLTGDAIDLTQLPVLTCWPDDGGPFMTLPQVYTRDPESGERNMGMYRMQVFDQNTTGMHWQTHKTGRAHMDKAKKMGLDRLPVAVAFGGDPILTYGATAPLPPGFDEVMFCGYMRGRRVRMVRCKTVDLEVPAEAEIVLEGYIDLHEPLRREGPFGDHTGYYSLADDFPAFHVTAITHRKDAIYPTTVVGIPPQEDGPMGKATERLFLELMRLQIPEVVDMNLPVEATFHNLMVVSIDKRYPGHARKAMMSLWGAGMVSLQKILVVVDKHVDVHDPTAVLSALLDGLDVARDVLIIDQVPTDTLDHAAPVGDLGSHIGFDATAPLSGEPQRRAASPLGDFDMTSEALRAHVPELVATSSPHARLLLVAIRKAHDGHAHDVVRTLWRAGLPEAVSVVVFEEDVDVADHAAALFHGTANLDPQRDILRDGPRLGVDATLKRPGEGAREWPDIIRMDAATCARVDKRWPEYGIPE